MYFGDASISLNAERERDGYDDRLGFNVYSLIQVCFGADSIVKMAACECIYTCVCDKYSYKKKKKKVAACMRVVEEDDYVVTRK